MADTLTPASGSPAPVSDRRPTPQGALPRRMQTWVLAGLAVAVVAIVFLAGEPTPPVRVAAPTAPPPQPDPERLRDYQDRLRVLETRPVAEPPLPPDVPTMRAPIEGSTPATEDPIVAERRRREYESLFASNVVLSRRPDSQRLAGAQTVTRTTRPADPLAPGPQSAASIDDIADAVVRATSRAGERDVRSVQTPPTTRAPEPVPSPTAAGDERSVPPAHADRIADDGPVRRLLEGTVIETVLTNRLDGAGAAPVNCLVTNAVYSHSGRDIVIPAGARILGTTKPVQSVGESRLAVAFHRLVLPDGRTFRLDEMPGLNQRGDAALHDRVNHHYVSTFGAAAAVGLVSGLSQMVGTAGSGNRGGTVVLGGGVINDTAQASAQVMSSFLNRLPTVTIREGHRIRVYLTRDVELPPYREVAPLTEEGAK